MMRLQRVGWGAGEQLEKKLVMEAEQAYHSSDTQHYAADCVRAMNTVRRHHSLLASTLDRFDALHRESMMEIIWKRQLSELEQAMKTVRSPQLFRKQCTLSANINRNSVLL